MAKEERPNLRASEATTSDTVILKVGPESKRYSLHKRLLIYSAEYFRGALSGNFREAGDGVISLGDVQTDVFDIFVDWLYEKRLPEHLSNPAKMISGNAGTLLLRTYALADRLIAPELKTIIFDAFFELCARRASPRYSFISLGFSILPERDPVLQLLIDAFWINGGQNCPPTDRKHLVQCLQNMPHAALVRMMSRMHELQGVGRIEKRSWRGIYSI